MTPVRYARLREALDRRQPDLTVLMENTTKTHNIAAIVRTCDAVGVFETNAVSEHGEIKRHRLISSGSYKWVRMKMHRSIEQAVDTLRSTGHRILAAQISAEANDFRTPDYTRPTAILLGSELPGVSKQAAALADEHIFVPMCGMVESLNVSVAAALILFEARRQREAAGMYTSGPRLPQELYDRILFEWAYPHIARRCRDKGVPYPALEQDGYLRENPLDQ